MESIPRPRPTSLAEVMFGLIMTLTFTLGAGVIIEDEGVEGVREMLVAVIGLQRRLGHHRRGAVPGERDFRARPPAPPWLLRAAGRR
jgi:hypothetical protein